MARRNQIEGAYPHPGTTIPDRTLRSGRHHDMNDPKMMHEARRLVVHSLSAQSYYPGFGLIFSQHRAKQVVSKNSDLVNRMLRENSPEHVAANILYRLDSLSGPRTFVKERMLLRERNSR